MKFFRKILHLIAEYLELIVAVVITVMVAISIVNMIIHIANNPMEIQDSEGFYTFLGDALSLIVGIEFLKMIIIPTSSNVIETLLFAVSRHIILSHNNISMIVVGVLSVAVLFIIKKYLFTDFEEVRTTILRASTKINTASRMANVTLPTNDGKTLGDLFLNKMAAAGRQVNEGSIIEISPKVALRADTITDDGIPEQIEIIHDHDE